MTTTQTVPALPTRPDARAAARAGVLLLIVQSLSHRAYQFLGLPEGSALLSAGLTTTFTLILCFPGLLKDLIHAGYYRPHGLQRTLTTVAGGIFASRLTAAGLLMMLPALRTQDNPFATAGLDLIPLFLGGALLIPLIEESVFRGALLRGHARHLPALRACLSTALIFAAAHQHPMSVIAIFPLALLLARVTLTTGSLWPALITHITNNTLALIAAQVVAAHPETANRALTQLGAGPMAAIGAAVFTAGIGITIIFYRTLKPTTPDPAPEQPGRTWLSAAYLLPLIIPFLPLILTNLKH